MLVSPEIFGWIDYLGTYIMGLSFATASVLYVLFFVKEPVRFKMFTLKTGYVILTLNFL